MKQKIKNILHFKFIKKIIFLIIFVLGIIFAFLIGKYSTKPAVADNQIVSLSPYKQETINKQIIVSIKNSNGIPITTIPFIVTTVALQKQIIIKGQTATAIKGRTFLIVNFKLHNSSSQDISMNTRNYVRLSVNHRKDLLASDIYNDPVDIQAISTQYSRLAFPIDQNFSSLDLFLGDITGQKIDIPLFSK